MKALCDGLPVVISRFGSRCGLRRPERPDRLGGDRLRVARGLSREGVERPMLAFHSPAAKPLLSGLSWEDLADCFRLAGSEPPVALSTLGWVSCIDAL